MISQKKSPYIKPYNNFQLKSADFPRNSDFLLKYDSCAAGYLPVLVS